MLPIESQPIKTFISSTTNLSSSLSSSIDVSDLASVLIQCFGLILVGYLSGKFGLISEQESNGISIFVGDFSLPALIFQSLAISNLSTINWSFVNGIFVSKMFLFILISIITLIITKPSNYGLAGLYGIFCTQSNDFAVGYPLLTSLYHDKHPDFADYLYVLASIQLAIINPIGLVMMEVQKQIQSKKTGQKIGSQIFFNVIKQIFKNPTLIMTIAGIVSNLIYGPILPVLLKPFINCLSEAFSATGLFLLGLNIVGRFSLFQSRGNSSSGILLPLILVMTKNILLPLIIKFVIQYLILNNSTSKEAIDLNNFGFLFGTFPTPPTVFIFALQYDLTTAIVSTAMVLSTIFSAPLMLISAYMINQVDDDSEYSYRNHLRYTMCYSGLLSVISICWVLIVLIFGRKWKSLTHRCLLAIAISQLFVGFGGFLWNYNNSNNESMNFISHLQYIFTLTGTISLQIWTCVLAITMALIHWKKLCYVIKIHRILIITATFSTFLLVCYIIYDAIYQKTNDNDQLEFQYISIYILELSIIITVFAILVKQYLKSKSIYNHSLNDNSKTTLSSGNTLNVDDDKQLCENEIKSRLRRTTICKQNLSCISVNEVEDIISCEQRKMCNQNICNYKEIEKSIEPPSKINLTNANHLNERHQMVHHFLLLLTLLFSMIIRLTVSLGNIIYEKPSGVFVELQFLDVLLNYGQGVVTFLIFGLDANFIFNKIFKKNPEIK